MRTFVFATLAVTLLFVSCKKEEEASPGPGTPPVDPTAYYPLTTGSYWIYEIWKIDSNGVETDLNLTDSVFVSGTEVINGKTYTVIKSTFSGNFGLAGSMRDSSNYLVDLFGKILFAPGDFTDPLETDDLINGGDTIYRGTSRMEKVEGALTVPAGSFEVLLNRRTYEISEKYAENHKHRELLEYRAPHVGVVVHQTAALANPDISERRLLRYHIN